MQWKGGQGEGILFYLSIFLNSFWIRSEAYNHSGSTSSP